MKIRILGVGCSKCDQLEENIKKAVEELGISAEIEKVSDLKTIVEYGVMKTPALVVDDSVKVIGRIPKVEEIKKYLK